MILGRMTPVGLALEARPASYLRGSRARAERVATLELEDLRRFKLAAILADGSCVWWAPQRKGSPITIEPGRVMFTFETVELAQDLELEGWRLVDDGGHLVRERRERGAWPKGHMMNAAYWLAFDGSDKKT